MKLMISMIDFGSIAHVVHSNLHIFPCLHFQLTLFFLVLKVETFFTNVVGEMGYRTIYWKKNHLFF